jgi:hypothetical protein
MAKYENNGKEMKKISENNNGKIMHNIESVMASAARSAAAAAS